MSKSLVDIVSQYGILLLLSRHLSYPDLVHLGQVDKTLNSFVLSHPHIRSKLKSLATCSGTGLAVRQKILTNLKTVDEDLTGDYIYTEEDDDAQAYERMCQPYNSQPCVRCGESTCEVR